MTLLLVGLVIFFGIHLVPSLVPLRRRLAAWKGDGIYRLGHSLVAAIGLALIIGGKAVAPYRAVYAPPAWTAHVAWVLMWFSLTLLPAAYLPTNLKRFVRHPFLWGVALWAVAHLLTNGDAASVLLFGSFAVFAVFDMASANRRGARPSSARLPLWRDAVLAAVGTAAYLAIIRLHPLLFGVSVNPG